VAPSTRSYFHVALSHARLRAHNTTACFRQHVDAPPHTFHDVLPTGSDGTSEVLPSPMAHTQARYIPKEALHNTGNLSTQLSSQRLPALAHAVQHTIASSTTASCHRREKDKVTAFFHTRCRPTNPCLFIGFRCHPCLFGVFKGHPCMSAVLVHKVLAKFS
jgi:hypothetical protein